MDDLRAATRTDPILGRTFRGYRIIRKIATGGMGAVYAGEQLSLGRRIAVKVLYKNLDDDPTTIERFRREALAVAQIPHPNIVAVHDVFEEQGRHFMIMEYVKGESLLKVLRQRKKLDVPLALRILLQTASALQAAHSKGIIHRDIKPGNLLLAHDGTVKVADFGIVKLTSDDANLTQTGYILGTPYYLSPEQALDGETDPRSDIYSLGATFYEMITGKRPYAGRTAAETIRRHIEGNLIPPSQLDPRIPHWVSDLVARMMAKRPEDRYPSCRDLIQGVKRAYEAARTPAPRARKSPSTVKLPSTRPAPVASLVAESPELDALIRDILDPREEARLLDELIDEEIERTGPQPMPLAILPTTAPLPADDPQPSLRIRTLLFFAVGIGLALLLYKIGEILF